MMNQPWLDAVTDAYGADSNEGRVARAIMTFAASNPHYAEFMIHDLGNEARLGDSGVRAAVDKLKGAGFIKPLLSGSLVHTVRLVTPEYSVPKDKPKAPRFGDPMWESFLENRGEVGDRDERSAQ